MKKIKSTLILGLLALFVIVGGVHATEQKIDVYEGEKLVKSVVFAIGLDEYYINNQLPGIKMDAAPFIEQDRTFIPVRYLGYALGLTEKDIAWDQENQKATLKGKTVLEMTINQKEIVTNGKAENIDVAPILKTEPAPRTYLPARYVAEGLGFQVDWDPDTRTVICWPQGESQPDVSAAQEHVKQIRDKETKQIEPNEEYTVNRGYKVPKETDLKVDFYDLYNIDVSTNILLFKPIEKQYQDLVLILTSKFSPELVDQVMAYVKQKTNWDQELKLKEWVANGCFIEVGSNAGNSGIQIDVRRI